MSVTGPIIDVDMIALGEWQLLFHLHTSVKPAETAAELTTGEIITPTPTVIDIEGIGSIRCQVWGVASDNNAPIIQLYGFPLSGTGVHLGQITSTMADFTSAATTGFHADPATHVSIRDEFDAGTAYRGCDVYVVATDYEDAIVINTRKINFPSAGFDISFENNQYKWLGVKVTSLGSATSIGGIYKVLSIKKGYSSPQFTA